MVDLKRKLPVLVSVVALISVMLTGCVEEYRTTTVQATVIEKEYDPPETTYKTVTVDGKTTKKKQTKPEEYEVTVRYKDIEKEFENEDLYDRVKEGQKINVIYEEGLDKNGKVLTESLELPE